MFELTPCLNLQIVQAGELLACGLRAVSGFFRNQGVSELEKTRVSGYIILFQMFFSFH